MKKFYSFLTLILLGVIGFAAQAVNIKVQCGSSTEMAPHLVVRNGGADGEIVETVPGEYYGCSAEFDLQGDLYLTTDSEEFMLSTIYYGSSYTSATVADNVCVIAGDDLSEGDIVNVNLQQIKNVTVLVKEGDADKIYIKKGYYDTLDVVEGENKVTLGSYDSMEVGVLDSDEYKMTSFYNVVTGQSYPVSSFRSASLYSSSLEAGAIYTYEIVPASEFELPSFRVRVDRPDLVVMQDASYEEITDAVANEWFSVPMSGSTSSFSVRSVNYGSDLYSVKLNGKEQSGSYGYYTIYDIAPDSEIDIKAEFPDEDYTVTVTVNPVENAGYIKSVTMNNETMDWSGEMTVHCGNKLMFSLDNNLYVLKGISVNGEEVDTRYLYNSWEAKITENCEICFDVEKKPTYQVKVSVNDAASVSLTVGGNKIALVDGENTVEFTEDASYASIAPSFGASINSIAFNYNDGEETFVNTTGSWTGMLSQNMESIDIDVTPLTRDKRYVFYFNSSTEGMETQIYSYNDYSRNFMRTFTQGYNVIEFSETENPICFGYYPRNLHLGYLNGEEAYFQYTGWQLTIADGDVFKVYDDIEPATYTATFAAEEEAEFTLLKDRIVTVEDFTSPISDLENTEFTIIAEGDTPTLDVYVQTSDALAADAESLGTKIAADDEGNYIVKLTSDLHCYIAKASGSGVEGVAAGKIAENSDVYTITGILVMRNASASDIKALPAGIYVSGGKKIVQK